MFVKFRTTENGAVAINPGYVVYMTPGQEPGTTSIRVSTGTILHVVGDYPLVLEKMTFGSQDQGGEDEDDQY
jgi:hypothetical protein